MRRWIIFALLMPLAACDSPRPTSESEFLPWVGVFGLMAYDGKEVPAPNSVVEGDTVSVLWGSITLERGGARTGTFMQVHQGRAGAGALQAWTDAGTYNVSPLDDGEGYAIVFDSERHQTSYYATFIGNVIEYVSYDGVVMKFGAGSAITN